MSILQTIDLKKYYSTKPNITRTLDGVNFSVKQGEQQRVAIACALPITTRLPRLPTTLYELKMEDGKIGE